MIKITRGTKQIYLEPDRWVTIFHFSNKEDYWKAFNCCSDLLGEIGPEHRDGLIFKNTRWETDMCRRWSATKTCVFTIMVNNANDARIIEDVL
jgi:hypothetical protein